MPKYTLYYYSGRGRGEVTRQILHLAGADWEDVRFEHDEWIAKYKPVAPFGQCPYIEFDGQTISQSHAMNTYLARKYGLHGKTMEDQARVDMISLSIDNYIVWPASLTRREKEDQKRRAMLAKKYEEEEMPGCCANINKQLEMNNGGNGWLVGDDMTFADLAFLHWSQWVPDGMQVEFPWEKYPKLLALRNRVAAHPKIAEWLKKRPVTSL